MKIEKCLIIMLTQMLIGATLSVFPFETNIIRIICFLAGIILIALSFVWMAFLDTEEPDAYDCWKVSK